jgi:hypothetical protein
LSFDIGNDDIALVESYKDKYDFIYMTDMTDVCGVQFVWREVTRREFKKLLQYYPDPYEREEVLCKLCVVEPEDYDYRNCEAGIPFTLASQILYESGFSPNGQKVNDLIAQYTDEMQSFEAKADAVITEAFPLISVDEIQDWSTEKIIKYFTLAQYKLSNYRGIMFEAVEDDGKVLDDGTVVSGDVNDYPELRGV